MSNRLVRIKRDSFSSHPGSAVLPGTCTFQTRYFPVPGCKADRSANVAVRNADDVFKARVEA